MIDPQDLIEQALESNFSHAAILETASIQFHEDFRKACEKNFCRKYDTNWMGPPAIGPVSELMKQVRQYRRGLLIQSIHSVASNFDMKGMLRAAEIHRTIFRELVKQIRARYSGEDFLPLDAGCCSVCERCAYLEREPCRHPDESVSSVEAYGMNVIALQKSAGLPYNNGKNNVTYVGLVLFEKQEVRS
jgi:predicted metal-binding protein